MENYAHKPRSLLFSFAIALTLISVATALICGGIILLSSLPGSSTACPAHEYYAVGAYYDSLSVARSQARASRSGGRAGYVMARDEGFFLISALYCAKSDAESVAERIDENTLALRVPAMSFNSDEQCIAAISALHEAVQKTEQLWRELDSGDTSESLTAKQLTSYALAINGYKEAAGGVGELCIKAASQLTQAASGGDFPMSADVKYASVAIAMLLNEFGSNL